MNRTYTLNKNVWWTFMVHKALLPLAPASSRGPTLRPNLTFRRASARSQRVVEPTKVPVTWQARHALCTAFVVA